MKVFEKIKVGNQRIVKLFGITIMSYKKRQHYQVIKRRNRNGLNPGKRFLLIQRCNPNAGFCSHVIVNIGWICYAYENGMIPVVDMQSTQNAYCTHNHNLWDVIFKQEYKVCDVLKSQDVVIIRYDGDNRPNSSEEYFNDKYGELTKWRDCAKRFLKIKQSAFDSYYNEDFEKALLKGKVIGVLARGTDYVALRPHAHPIPPPPQMIIDDIRELMKMDDEYCKGMIYLVTEDENIVKEFKIAFGEKLILAKQNQIKYNGVGFLADKLTNNQNVEQAKAYFKAIFDLARCNYIFAARTSGSVVCAFLTDSPGKYYCLGEYD